MVTQSAKGAAFRALHARDGAFIIPNPWDTGTAWLLAHVGFEALATTSAGCAFSKGQRDNTIGRDDTIAHVATIAAATGLPVSASSITTLELVATARYFRPGLTTGDALPTSIL